MRKLNILFIAICLSSCSMDVILDVEFKRNRKIDAGMKINFSNTLTEKGKDEIEANMKILTGMFVKVLTDKNVDIDMDKINMQDSIPIKKIRIAFDTLNVTNKDTILFGLNKRDSTNILTDKEKQELCDFIHHVTSRMYLSFNYVPNQELNMGLELIDCDWDTLSNEYYYTLLDKLPKEKKNPKVNFWRNIKWENKEITIIDNRDKKEEKNNAFNLEKFANFQTSNLIINFRFPGKIKKSKNSIYNINEDKKSITIKKAFNELDKEKMNFSNKIKYQ